MKTLSLRAINVVLALTMLLVPFAASVSAALVETLVAPATDVPALNVLPAWTQPSRLEHKESLAVQSSGPEVEWENLPPEIQAKVDPRILAELQGEVIPAHLGGDPEQAEVAPRGREPLESTRFLVYLTTEADPEAIAQQRFTTRLEQRTAVFNALVSTAQATQETIKTLLNARMNQGDVVSYQSFYIFNGFAVQGDLDTIIELALRDDVERIVANYPLVFLSGSGKGAAAPAYALHPDNWNIDLVDADRVWDEFGITGEGAVVGGIDTGVRWTHSALQSKYRGYDADGSHDHNYNWFDPNSTLYPGGDLGASRTTVPFDNGDHGTHTMGTMVGDGGTADTQIGMAPGAKWIAISLNRMGIAGSMTDDIMAHKAFQWMLCPTDLTGALSTADCSKAPDVVNNSWGSANPADDTFRPDIAALRAAGVAPVFASGNPSAGAGSIGAPGCAPEAITVGATDIDDNVASFSGRGPSFYEGEQKPELSAPGVDIKSSIDNYDNAYSSFSGTSMAAPAVAGLVALMVSADLEDGVLDFNVDELEAFMEHTAVDLGPAGPDDDYGYGRIDAYNAVRWVRSAGDLRGTVRDASTSAPIEGATVTGVKTNPGDTFTTWTGASGQYSTTVPAGTYNITVEAWGYYSDTFSGQTVITGALSIADFALTAMPTTQLTGQVLNDTTPISGALVYLADAPSVNFTTGASGNYILTLPVGIHEMVVEVTGYRILHEGVSVAGGGSSHDFDMTPAPTILLVEADTHAGWFVGWPVRNFFGWALDYENYLYDTWIVQYTTFNDMQVMADGSLGYGIPSTTTLGSYDLVIWAHGGGNFGTTGSTVDMGADDELMDYLDNDGRLIISGQDLSWDDWPSTFHNNYLHADYVMDTAAGEGDTVSGVGFLAGLNLKITNASLHGYANGITGLWPDAVAPQDGTAYPVLTYDNGNGTAALAVDPCDASYRVVFFALGFENIAPRAYTRDPDVAEVLDRSIGWTMGSKPAYGVSVSAAPGQQIGEPGAIANHNLTVVNTGATTDTYDLSLSGNAWTTRILSGTTEVVQTMVIAPCDTQLLNVEVTIPGTANAGDTDTFNVTATSQVNPATSGSSGATTMAFPPWQIETPMPTPRYRLAAANLPDDIYYYVIGGQGNGGSTPMDANERYNACIGEWESMTPMPTPRGNIGAAMIDGRIYVPGGYESGSVYYDILEIYDLPTDSWSSGASMPEALSGASVAAYDGKLYTFGGSSSSGYTDKTYEYDPATDTWTEKAPMPGGARAYVAAAELNGQIYVVGGWENVNTVEAYDPAADSWSTAASMNVGRQSPGLTATPDGYLYVSGGGNGWTGLTSAERYDPASDTWEIISSLNDRDRAGSASTYAAGRVFAVGGSLSDVNESLQLYDTFCNSDKFVQQSTVQPGDRLTYTVEIHADPVTPTSASLVDPIPAGTTFAGFGANPIGATYNGADDQVEWSGTILAKTDPVTFTFGVDVATGGWTIGDPITNAVTFNSGAGLVFTRTVVAVLDFPDASLSTKGVDKSEALAGDALTYTIHVENGSIFSDVFTLRDPIPANATYVPGSLTYTLGSSGYDPVNDVIAWTGTLPDIVGHVVGGYEWGDSDGNGTVPGVTFDWIDISGTGTNAGTGSSSYYCSLPIGFTFNFYGTDETIFCADTNGFVSFDTSGYSDSSNDCPLPSTWSNEALIAGIWDDLVVDGGIYYQTFGTAPNRYLVVQWADVRHHYGSSTYFAFEVILYENGAIKVQTLDAGPESGSGSTTGIEDYTETQGLTYACNTTGSIHDNLAILFQPFMVPIYSDYADVTFAVTVDAPLPVNTWITNTTTITGSYNTVEHSAGTLINPVDLSGSTKTTDKTQATVGEVVTYDFFLQNTGLLTATINITDSIPADTTYVPGSLTYTLGTGDYDGMNDVITWTGTLPVPATYVNTSGDYEWGGSDGNGTVPGVTFDWIDISGTGTNAGTGSSSYYCSLPIGFTFDFYGTDETIFCASTNGFVSFDTSGSSDSSNDCPLPSTWSNEALIAGIWDDLVTVGGIYYQTFGAAPNRYLVVQWVNVRHYGSSTYFAFEVILYENGAIKAQMLDAGPETGSGSTTGIEDYTETQGLTYACNTPDSIHDNLAVVFLPDGASWMTMIPSADVTFAVTLTTALPDWTPVTNTATLDDGYGTLYDLEAIFLARSSDLSASFKQADPAQVEPGGTITYTVYARNSGAADTTGEMRDKLPPELTYVPGSVSCGSGSCGYASGVITWTGTVYGRSMVPVRFLATVPGGASHGDLITNTAVVTDTAWNVGHDASIDVPVILTGQEYIYLPLVLRSY